jgi:site-specific recombinase XerD
MPKDLIAISPDEMLPPILAGQFTPSTKHRVEKFYSSIAEIFETWVTRRQSPHTQRAYREDFMAFIKFLGIRWPDEAAKIIAVSVKDVHAFREQLVKDDKAPKTLNRRISSVSSFYKYLSAAELRLPITVPNPAHVQFIARQSADPREETRALTATRARQLMGLPADDSLLDFCGDPGYVVFKHGGSR